MLVLLDWIIIRIFYYLSQWFPINDVLVSRGILRVVTDQAGTETQGLEDRGYGAKPPLEAFESFDGVIFPWGLSVRCEPLRAGVGRTRWSACHKPPQAKREPLASLDEHTP